MSDDTPEAPKKFELVAVYIRHWLPSAVTVVVLLGVVLATALYTERRRDYVECHTEAMDALHVALYSHLAMDPKQPRVWGQAWALAFAAWEDRIKECPHIE